jgi:hypothetical protein
MEAQQCIGQAPWSAGKFKVGGSIEINGGTDIAGHVATGKDGGFFFNAGAGINTDSDQIFIAAGAGKELGTKLADKISLCPIAGASYHLEKHGFSAVGLSGGLSGGYPVELSSSSFSLILTGSGQLGFSKLSGDFCDLPGADCSSMIGIFTFGAGFILSERISLVPQIVLPTEGDIALLVVANIALGGGM